MPRLDYLSPSIYDCTKLFHGGNTKNVTVQTQKRIGFVLGKFMPLHRGHEALLRFAQDNCDQLYVVVDNIPNAWVAAEQRCRWIEQTVPQAVVKHLPAPNPQDPSEHPQFWDIWRDTLRALLPEKPDVVFASETYGERLAQELGAVFVPFDIARAAVPVSATMIRNDLAIHWPLLSAAARRDYTFKVCIFGPESTGKSALTQKLAEHYQTVGVREYARDVIEAQKEITASDMLLIARGQQALIDEALPNANRVLLTDTDALSTTVWTRWLYGAPDTAVEELARTHPCDFYLLLSPDLPWVPDMVRYFEGRGQEFFDDCEKTLQAYGRPYAVIGGQGDARLENAIRKVDQAMASFFASIGRN